jgi:hypothetical protein
MVIRLEVGARTPSLVPEFGEPSELTDVVISFAHYPLRLPATDVGMVVDMGDDFPEEMLHKLQSYGPDAWIFRDRVNEDTSRGLVTRRGDDTK